MNRLVPLLLAALTVGACADPVAPAGGRLAPGEPSRIVNGTPDAANAWPAVGALLYDWNGDGTFAATERFCTGTLISPTIVLTAAHCVAELQSPVAGRLAVSFDTDLTAGTSRIVADGYSADARFPVKSVTGNALVYAYDQAVVFLPEGATAGITPMRLPTAAILDQMRAASALGGAMFINVGYGRDASLTGPPEFYRKFLRQTSRSPFQALTQAALMLLMSQNATGEGGICVGDSGGPTFLDRDGYRDVVMATKVSADNACRATNGNHRLDTPEARSFLGQFVVLP
jgi:hypothetical protein